MFLCLSTLQETDLKGDEAIANPFITYCGDNKLAHNHTEYDTYYCRLSQQINFVKR